MDHTWRLSRRTVLQGLGTSLALPLLDAMEPALAWASGAAAEGPLRMAFFYVPNGAHMQDWTPEAEGPDFQLPATLEPLAPLKDRLLVLTGLAQTKSRANGDGPGDHARALATFLTGCQAKKTHGADIRVGVSVDQLAAQSLGGQTKFESLELGCDANQQSGSCDSGYSCAYSSNMSWSNESTPVAKEVDPRQLFERLFGDDTSGAAVSRGKRLRYRKSVLDFVREDASDLHRQLGAKDQHKLDEYLSAVRELEQRIEMVERSPESPPSISKPAGIPKDYAEHIRLLGDLFVVALQADLTRVSTFVFANEGSGRPYPFIDVPEGHHDLSHHGGNKDKQAKIQKINRFHIEQFAYIVQKLASVPEGGRTLLDNMLIVYGSGIGDGNRHNHDDLPVLLVGRGGGRIRAGQHLKFPFETPLTNLYLSMLDLAGAPTETLGDSTGPLTLPLA